jgi:hypothetical protein
LLNVYNVTGNSWGAWLDVADVGRTNDAYRGFSIQTEETTGDFLAVYETNTTANRIIYYRTWNGTNWSSEGTITLSSDVAAEQQTIIRLDRKPNSEEIMMASVGGTDNISAARWDGDSWENITRITKNGAALDEERFSIEHESLSGDAMLAWGEGNTNANYSIFDNTTKAWSPGQLIRNRSAVVQQITVCSDPQSDYIGVIIGPDSLGDVLAVIWNGTEWINGEPLEEDNAENVAVTNADCSWTNSSGIALFTYVDADGLAIRYFTYNRTANTWICPSNGQTVTNLSLAQGSNGPCTTGNIMSDDIEMLRHAPDINSNDIMLFGSDVAEDFEMFIFNGTGIAQPPTALLETVTTTAGAVEPGFFDYFKYSPAEENNAPNITISSPTNITYGTTSITFNFSVSDDTNNTNMSCWKDVGSGFVSVGTIASGSSYQSSETASSGSNTWIAVCFDGVQNRTAEVNFTVDITEPILNLISPANTTYGSTNVTLTYTAWDMNNVSQCKYELNGVNSSAIPNCANTTFTAVSGSNSVKVWANDTFNNWDNSSIVYFTVTLGAYLEVSLTEPPDSTSVTQNRTFRINATVYCRGGSCGNVDGTARYNYSSSIPDTAINTTTGDYPLFVTDNENPKSCPLALEEDDSCNLTWIINATGDIGSYFEIDVNFTSSLSQVKSNDTGDSTVNIVCLYLITLQWSSINFSTVDPGNYGNAAGNDNRAYNITVESDSCPVDLYIKGDDLNQTSVSYKIGAGNVTWNTTNKYPGFKLSKAYALINSSINPNTNITTYYWIDMPYRVATATYNSTLWIKGVENGGSP